MKFTLDIHCQMGDESIMTLEIIFNVESEKFPIIYRVFYLK